MNLLVNKYLGIFILLLTLGSCKNEELVTYLLPPEPIVRLISPQNDQVISDSVSIAVETYDDKGLTWLGIYIDDQLEYSDKTNDTIHEYLWNTSYLQEGSKHKIKAKGFDADGNSTTSKEAEVTVYRFTPSNLNAHLLTDSTIELTWQDNSKFETGFEIEQAVNDTLFKKITLLDSNKTSYILKGNFSLNQRYYFRIRAIYEGTYSWYSNTVSASLFLTSPTQLTVTIVNDTSAHLEWTDNSFFEDAFEIEIKIAYGDYRLAKMVAKNTINSDIQTIFSPNQFYSFRVRAKTSDIYSGYSNVISSIFQFPAPVFSGITQISETSLKLTWEGRTSFEEGFIIERGTSYSNTVEIGRVGQNVASFIDQGLDVHKKYYYKLYAFTKHNKSNYTTRSVVYSPWYSASFTVSLKHDFAYSLSPDEKVFAVNNPGKAEPVIELYTADYFHSLLRQIYSTDPLVRTTTNIEFSKDGKYIAGVNSDNTLTLWNTNVTAIYKSISVNGREGILRFNPDLHTVAFATKGNIYFWNYTDGSIIKVLNDLETSGITSFVFNQDGNHFLVGGAQGLSLWDKNSWSKIRDIVGSSGYSNAAFSKDGKYIIASNSSSIAIWENAGSTLPKQIVSGDGTRQAVMSSDNNYVYSVSNSRVSCYLLPDGELIDAAYFTDMPTSIMLLNDGLQMICKFSDRLVFWTLKFEWVG